MTSMTTDTFNPMEFCFNPDVSHTRKLPKGKKTEGKEPGARAEAEPPKKE